MTLLSRLQSLTEPSREIDAEIALANGWTFEAKPRVDDRPWWRKPGASYVERCLEPPRYSESLDAALALVPEGWTVGVHSDCHGRWFAEIQQCGVGTHISWPNGGEARAINAAIALLIEIMKARKESALPSGDKPRARSQLLPHSKK